MIKLKDLLNEAPRDLHFKGARQSGPNFSDARKAIAIAAHKLAATVTNTGTPGYADPDRDPYNRGKEAAVIHAMGKFENEISTLERQWQHLQRKHGI